MSKELEPAVHSPGPWTSVPGYGNYTITDANGKAVALVRLRKDGENQCVLSASTELLDCLKQFINGVQTGLIDSCADETLENLTRKSLLAIRKAEGLT